jgi:hypothetical protein
MNGLPGFGRMPEAARRLLMWQALRPMTPRTAVAMALGGSSLLLGMGAMLITWHGRHKLQTLAQQESRPPQITASVPTHHQDLPSQPRWPRLEELHASLRQPPFYPDRKLPADQTPASSTGDERYRLAGTVVSGQRRFAIIENRTTKETKRLGVGESLDGLPITEVLPNRVILGQGTQRRELNLTWAPSPTAAPRRTVIAEPEKKARQQVQDQQRKENTQRPSPNRGVRR